MIARRLRSDRRSGATRTWDRPVEALLRESDDGHNPLLLEGGLDWKSMSLSPKDMDFIEARHVLVRAPPA